MQLIKALSGQQIESYALTGRDLGPRSLGVEVGQVVLEDLGKALLLFAAQLRPSTVEHAAHRPAERPPQESVAELSGRRIFLDHCREPHCDRQMGRRGHLRTGEVHPVCPVTNHVVVHVRQDGDLARREVDRSHERLVLPDLLVLREPKLQPVNNFSTDEFRWPEGIEDIVAQKVCVKNRLLEHGARSMPRIGTDDLAQNHVRLLCVGHFDHSAKGIGRQAIIGVQKEDELACSTSDRRISRTARGPRVRLGDHCDPRVLGRHLRQRLSCTVCRPIINDDDLYLVRLDRLIPDRSNRFRQVVHGVVGRDDDGYLWGHAEAPRLLMGPGLTLGRGLSIGPERIDGVHEALVPRPSSSRATSTKRCA